MGFYVQVPVAKGKVDWLRENCDAKVVAPPGNFELVEKAAPDKALICVVDNGPFEAAALCYDSLEFERFNEPDEIGPAVEQSGNFVVFRSEFQARGEQRPRTWLLMDKVKAYELSGFR